MREIECEIRAEHYSSAVQDLFSDAKRKRDGRILSIGNIVDHAIGITFVVIGMVAVSMVVVLIFGPLSWIALLAYAAIPLLIWLYLVVSSVLDRVLRIGDGALERMNARGIAEQIERGRLSVPLGRARVRVSEDGIELVGESVGRSFAWEHRPRVMMMGSGLIVLPGDAGRGEGPHTRLGVPRREDVRPDRMIVIPAQAFSGEGAMRAMHDECLALAGRAGA